jgi:hypothetical protein
VRKTLAFYIEKYLGRVLASLMVIWAFKSWNIFSIISEADFFDKAITISTTLFGFLLTVLALIIQGASDVVASMKKHGSFGRLVKLNKTIVLLYVLISFSSLILCVESNKLHYKCTIFLKYPSLVLFWMFTWALIDTVIFTLIFYKIVLAEEK